MPNSFNQKDTLLSAVRGLAGKAALAFLMLFTVFSHAAWAQTPPGVAFPGTSELSDQKPGSILVYNLYTSDTTTPAIKNTELNLTNTHPTTAVTVRLFLISETGAVTNHFLTLAPRQTVGYLASDLDPNVTGYLMAVAVNTATGCPINFNYLAGDAFVKLPTGHAAGLQAEAIAAIAANPAVCGGGSTTLNFDGVNYNKLPRMLAMNNIPARPDGNSTIVVLNRIGGDLSSGAATLGAMFGLISDDIENVFSLSFSGSSQFRSELTDTFPRTVPRFTMIIPAGRSGWMKFYKNAEDFAILGASLNFNPGTGSNAIKYNNGQNFSHRRLTEGGTTLTMPVSTTTCSFGIAPTSAPYPAGGGSGSVNVTAAGGCLWTAVSNDSWITTTSAAFGKGNGALNYAVVANPGMAPRTGTMTIGGQTFTVMQAGNCGTITIGPPNLPNGAVGVNYNQTLTASGGTPTYTYTITGGALPAGMSLSPGGALTGPPSANGTFNFTVKATDANGCMGTQSYTLVICGTITVNPSNPTLTVGTVGTPYSQGFTQLGGSGTITWSNPGGGLAGGLTLDSSTGVLSGMPTTAGGFTFTIQATDINNCTGTRQYSLTINPALACPTVNNINPTSGVVGASVTITGTNFTGVTAVKFSSNVTASFTVVNATTITTTVPAGAVTGAISISKTSCSDAQTGTFTVTVGNGLQFYPLPSPVRLLDTRPGASPNACSQPNAAIAGGTSRTQSARSFCGIPANAQAITGNVTTVASGGGYLTLYPSDAAQPTVASTNYNPDEVVNNVFTVGLGAADGAFKIFALNTTDAVVDVTGYYAPPGTGGLYFHTLPAPVRLLETRAGEPIGCVKPGVPLTGGQDSLQTATTACTGIPATARAIVGNATTVSPQSGGFLTLFPADAIRPLVASSNYNFDQVINGPFTVGLSATGQFKIFTLAQTHLIVDVLGYYSTEATDANGVGLSFTPLAHPVRLLETRGNPPNLTGCFKPGAPLGGNQVYTQPARSTCDSLTIPATALGVVGNATVISPAVGGYLTLWPSTALQPTVATSNFNAGQVFNRHFIVGLGNVDGAFKIFSSATTDLVIDVSGYFAP